MTDGLLRRLRGEAARAERHRILDALTPQLEQAEREHRLSNGGRRADGLRIALDLVQPGLAGDPPWDEYVGTACSEIDEVQVGLRVGDPDPRADGRPDEGWPVRLLVHDSGSSTVASAWMTIDEAERTADLLRAAATRAREARCLTPAELCALDDATGQL